MFKVLLLCNDNAVFGPLAETYFRKFAGERAEVYCAGIDLRKRDPGIDKIIREEGLPSIDSKQHMLPDFQEVDFDYVLTFDVESEAESHHLPSRPIKYHYHYEDLGDHPGGKPLPDKVLSALKERIRKDMNSFIRTHFDQKKAV